MVLSRRFLNLVVANGVPGVKSLRRIDMTSHLFYPCTPPSRGGVQDGRRPASKIEGIRLPSPTFNFRASASDLCDQWRMDCFPVMDGMLICADQSGRSFLFDADERYVKTMPALHQPKLTPISLFAPNADADDDVNYNGFGSSVFVMERVPKPEATTSEQQSHQFEVFTYRKPSVVRYIKAFHCHRLPPPPFVYEPSYWQQGGVTPEISSYAVVAGGSEICISVHGVGTYCLRISEHTLHTRDHTWNKVGEWTLPFIGKVEYVPEFKLWFGISAEDQCVAAADLSTMGSKPVLQQAGPWNELHPPEEWKERKDPQLVNLGFGRLCVARFFQDTLASELTDGNFAVLTGVEVNGEARGGEVKLQMTPHKSRRVNTTSIEALF